MKDKKEKTSTKAKTVTQLIKAHIADTYELARDLVEESKKFGVEIKVAHEK